MLVQSLATWWHVSVVVNTLFNGRYLTTKHDYLLNIPGTALISILKLSNHCRYKFWNNTSCCLHFPVCVFLWKCVKTSNDSLITFQNVCSLIPRGFKIISLYPLFCYIQLRCKSKIYNRNIEYIYQGFISVFFFIGMIIIKVFYCIWG